MHVYLIVTVWDYLVIRRLFDVNNQKNLIDLCGYKLLYPVEKIEASIKIQDPTRKILTQNWSKIRPLTKINSS